MITYGQFHYYVNEIPRKAHGNYILDKKTYLKLAFEDYECVIEQIIAEHIIGDVTK